MHTNLLRPFTKKFWRTAGLGGGGEPPRPCDLPFVALVSDHPAGILVRESLGMQYVL